MIQEVLSLGIKGDVLIASTLKKIQKQKELFAKPVKAAVSVQAGRMSPAAAQRPPASEAAVERAQVKQDRQSNIDVGGLINTAAHGIASGSANALAGGLASGIGKALGAEAGIIGGLLGPILDMGKNFSDTMRASTDVIAENAKAVADIGHYTKRPEEQNKLSESSEDPTKFRFNRSDLTNQRTADVFKAVGGNMVSFSKEFRDAVKELVGTNEQRFDIEQTKQIGQGRFSALGTDKGFFMEQIAAGFQNLPPSFRQKLLPQLWKQVGPGERQTQIDLESRGTQAGYHGAEIENAYKTKQEAGAGADTQALDEIRKKGQRDAQLTGAQGELLSVLGRLDSTLNKFLDKIPGLGRDILKPRYNQESGSDSWDASTGVKAK